MPSEAAATADGMDDYAAYRYFIYAEPMYVIVKKSSCRVINNGLGIDSIWVQYYYFFRRDLDIIHITTRCSNPRVNQPGAEPG